MITTRVSALKPKARSTFLTVLNARFKLWLRNAHIATAESSVTEWKPMAGCIVARIVPVIPVFQRWRTEPHRSETLILLGEPKHARSSDKVIGGKQVVSTKQKAAARKNIKKAVSSAKRKRTIAHLPKSVRTALGKKASSVAKKNRKSRSHG